MNTPERILLKRNQRCVRTRYPRGQWTTFELTIHRSARILRKQSIVQDIRYRRLESPCQSKTSQHPSRFSTLEVSTKPCVNLVLLRTRFPTFLDGSHRSIVFSYCAVIVVRRVSIGRVGHINQVGRETDGR